MAGGPQGDGRGRDGYGLVGFLAMAFAVVGLTGLLAAHVAPLPLERALAREAALDEALAAARGGQPAALEALRLRLGESAQAILPAGPDFEAKVAAERAAMRARMLAEAAATGTRLRWMLVVVTLLGGAFGIGMMLAGLRAAGRAGEGERVAAGREMG